MKYASIILFLALAMIAASLSPAQNTAITADMQNGYFRYPAVHGNTIVFTAEGDLWKVSAEGGVAQRLTTDYGQELCASISPDGSTVAYTGSPEGAQEVYTIPIDGGLPVQRTFDGGWARVVGWTHDGDILFATARYSTLPDVQMAIIDMPSGTIRMIPLSQAYDGCYDQDKQTFYFTREPFLGSHTKRYRGGAAQNIWKLTPGAAEAVSLTTDYPGISKNPMLWNGRIYFLSDRDGTMNIWSMDDTGGDLVQLTHHVGWDIQSPSLDNGRIAYQLGADIHVFNIAANVDRLVPIRLVSDFDQMREEWVKKPFDYLTAAHISPDGDRVVLTARGEVFTAPAGQGRIARATHEDGVRYRQARFMPDGKNLLVLSDKSGEVEFWQAPANGVGDLRQLTDNGKILRFDGVPSPDGKFIAYTDKNDMLWIYDIEKKIHTKVYDDGEERIINLSWSPDGQWLAFVAAAKNWFQQIRAYNVRTSKTVTFTTDRYDNFSPSWSPDGKWLYFLSNRHLVSLVSSPWGVRQAEPYFDRKTKIYLIPLVKGLRSPFRPEDELVRDSSKADTATAKKDKKKTSDSIVVKIDADKIENRIMDVPIPPGNYTDLSVTGDHLFWLSREDVSKGKKSLVSAKIDNEEHDVDTLVGDVKNYEMSADRKKLMIRKGDAIYVFDADGKKPSDLGKAKVKLDDWTFTIDPRLEWRQMFIEAWRLERDYFYDRNMHGVDWPAMLNKYLPLVKRITDRDELTNLLGQLISELTSLHMYVFGGDARRSEEDYPPATLGAFLTRDDDAGGYVIDHIYLSDPDRPDKRSPLAQPDLNISDGDIIVSINGVPTLSVADPYLLLRHEAGKQVLLEIKSSSANDTRRVIVVPITQREDRDLRYGEWEFTRRQMVDQQSDSTIGYVHLRAMSAADFTQWAREFYPIYLRQGLIIDVRHNNGGSIDSWILERLLRKPWIYWQSRTGNPYYNMQYAFAGHVVVLCDERTYSDGEMFTEGIKRLGIGKVIGKRTAGAEIWLSYSNTLVDRGIASAAESGVYGPEGKWVIENHGVEPDIVVDNLPHETFKGKDAQLEAAIKYLKEQIRLHPVETPQPPPYPDKSSPDNR
jgi:tricorn protease